MEIIARIYNGFETKFGIPRQGGLVDIKSEIVFEPKYRDPAAIKGLEGYSHIWLLWNFSESRDGTRALTVRPPRLGGNKRVGVFATRSPFRPNPIGLSAVKLEEIKFDERGTVLIVSGADLMNGTPIYDIKPYIPEFDSIPEAHGGFAEKTAEHFAEVKLAEGIGENIPENIISEILALLSQDPKPAYQNDGRVYGMRYARYEIKFTYSDNTVIVTEIFNDI